MKFLGDKGQITSKSEREEVHSWQNQDTAEYQQRTRRVMVPNRIMRTEQAFDEKGELTVVDFVGVNPDTGGMDDTYPLNQLPPGMFSDNQQIPPMSEAMPFRNSWDADVTKLTPGEVRAGFKQSFQSTVEETSNDPQPLYDEAKGEDEGGNKITGFAYRRNNLDRG